MENTNSAKLPGDIRSHLAWIRTRLSAERTLEAWVRTAASLIAFGFAIVQFLGGLSPIPGAAQLRKSSLSRYLGLMLIGVGTLALVIASWQYQKLLKYLHSEPFHPVAGIVRTRRLHPTVTTALLLCLVGAITFFIVLMRTITG
jgi:putative membrane protein